MMNQVQQDCTGYELALGALNGFRRFKVDRLGRLTALHYDYVWRPGENVARCRAMEHREFCSARFLLPCECPPRNAVAFHDDRCPCGFYAFLDCGERRYGKQPDGLVVGGVIEGYGKTLVGSKGFRCEKATVLAVVVPWRSRLLRRGAMRLLRRNYPDVQIRTSKRLAARRFGVTLKAVVQSPENDPNFWTRP